MKLTWYKISIVLIAGALLFSACETQTSRKIKLASNRSAAPAASQNVSSVLRITADQQRSIAILAFENRTGDASLDWLQRGLADMLVTELTQSPYLNIISLKPSAERQNREAFADLFAALQAAKETQATMMVAGRYHRDEDSLQIDVEIIDVNTGQTLRREMVRGHGLEEIFSMVDRLSESVRSNVRGDLDDRQYAGVNLNEMTESVEAFRCYSEALSYMEKFMVGDAEKCLQDAIKHDSTFAAGYLRLAQLKLQLGQKDEAQVALQKTRRYIDRLSEADRQRIQLLESRLESKYFDYLTQLEEAVKQFPSNTEFRMELANVYREFGDLDRALQEYEIVLEQDPNQKSVYNLLGYIFAWRGDFTTALKYIDKYIELAPDEPNPYDSRGEILMMAGRLEEAEKALNQAIEKWPQFFYSYWKLSELATEFGDFQKALRYATLAMEKSPGGHIKPHLHLQQAMIYWRFDKIQAAETVLDEVLAKNPTHVGAMRIASEIYKSLGDTLRAHRLQESIMQRLKEKLDQGQADAVLIDRLVDLSLTSDVMPAWLPDALEEGHAHANSKELQTALYFATGFAYLRLGQPEQAKPIFEKHADEMIDLITIKHNRGWGSGWKYIFESLDCEPVRVDSRHPFSERLLKIARETNRNDLEVIARLSRTRSLGHQERKTPIVQEYLEMGFPLEESWRIIGPFSAKDFSGFEHAFPPEKELRLDATYINDRRKLAWQAGNDGHYDGYINLRSQLKDSFWTVGYGWIYVYSPEKRTVQIRLGTDETCKLWVNDDLVWKHYIKQDALLDRDRVKVMLHPGYNKVLLKVTNTDFDWGFYFRITDEQGKGYSDLIYYAPNEVEQSLSQSSFSYRDR